MQFNFTPFDWNAVGAIASLISLGSLVYAYVEYKGWKDARSVQASIFAPLLRLEFTSASMDLSAGAISLRAGFEENKPIVKLRALAGACQVQKTVVISEAFDRLDLFGSSDGAKIAEGLVAVLHANALLRSFSSGAGVYGIDPEHSGAIEVIADYMDRAMKSAIAAAEIADDHSPDGLSKRPQ
jgi:hypothetical protein